MKHPSSTHGEEKKRIKKKTKNNLWMLPVISPCSSLKEQSEQTITALLFPLRAHCHWSSCNILSSTMAINFCFFRYSSTTARIYLNKYCSYIWKQYEWVLGHIIQCRSYSGALTWTTQFCQNPQWLVFTRQITPVAFFFHLPSKGIMHGSTMALPFNYERDLNIKWERNHEPWRWRVGMAEQSGMPSLLLD